MVFFTCNACNESLKKNQVEKHFTQKCRRCEYLSCVDCGKDFWGDTYAAHIKCITEDQKYSGKNYVAKVNKGEVKQEQWCQKVQAAIQKAPANSQLSQLLHRLEEYPNVPRKKPKFENFLKCSLRVYNTGLLNGVWDLLMAETQEQNGNGTQSGKGGAAQADSKSSQPGATEQNAAADVEEEEEEEKKLNKKEKKEERRKKAHKAEKKDKHSEDGDGGTEENGERKNQKKGKRRKRDRDEEEDEENAEEEEDSKPKKKKKKGENGTTEESSVTTDNGSEPLEDSVLVEERTGKFNWGNTITAVLESKGEISIKKLRKKVLAEYALYGGGKGEERVEAKFNKKLSKLPNVKVLKEKAKLVQS